MATTTVTSLPTATKVADSDYLLVDQSGVTTKASVAQLVGDQNLVKRTDLSDTSGASGVGTNSGTSVQQELTAIQNTLGGIDTSLRKDLSGSTGAGLVGVQSGTTVQGELNNIKSELGATVRSTDLASANGASLIGTASGNTVQQEINQGTLADRSLWAQTLAESGLTLSSGSFEEGASVSSSTQAVWSMTTGKAYIWKGSLPKTVNPKSTPESTGGISASAWVSVDSITLRSMLLAADGVKLVNNAVDKRGDTMQRLIITGDSSAASTGNLVVGNLPIPAGTDAARDAVTVARLIQNGPTNCHAFADKTVIDGASDYGGYGSVDVTVKLSGDKVHNHVYSFQDRPDFNSSGTLENLKGFMSSPTLTGTGQINDRSAVYINDVLKQGTGKLIQQSGILIEHLQAAEQANVGIHIKQMSGLAYYAPNAGRMFQNGVAGFGVDPSVSNFPINWRGDQNGTFYGFATTDVNGMSLGVSGDTRMQFIAANEVRLQIKSATTFQRAVTPGNDNATPLGDVINRWGTIFAGTGTINTSDGREKTAPVTAEELSQLMAVDSDSILDAWGEVSVIAFQWLSSIAAKGEDSARWHFGVIAQQVKQAFDSKGIDGTRLGLLCYDEWDDVFDIIPEEVVEHPAEYSSLLDAALKPIVLHEAWTEVVKAEEHVLVTPAGNRWGIRSDQCLWLEAAYQRRESQRLKDRLSKIEGMLADK